ncbi:MAG: Hsp20/alpha crystallin family protein [Anaerolineae bacterium]|nr:Hsp20/alpha crystallin family protein [Anaerolineae bacterium]
MPITDLIPWKRDEQRVPVRREEQSMLALQQDMNRLFDDFFRSWGVMPWRGWGEQALAFNPQVDVVEDEKEIHVSAELPGMDENDIDVSLSQGVLTIKGEKRHEKKDEGKNYYRLERSYGSFQRSIPLPAEVNEDKVEATFKNGVLTVTLPKTAAARARKQVAIKTG